jgi:hypothetical protein
MKHMKVIEPSDPSEIPLEALPDRSDLSKLYLSSDAYRLKRQTDAHSSSEPSTKTAPTDYRTIDQNIVSLLITLPFIVTHLAAVFIYCGSDTSLIDPNPLFPLISFFVSAAWFITCVVSLRILWKRFYGYTISLSGFITLYLFYALPMLKLTYDLFQPTYVGIISAVLLWLIANRLIVSYIMWSINRPASSSINRAVIIALPILILAICAILF